MNAIIDGINIIERTPIKDYIPISIFLSISGIIISALATFIYFIYTVEKCNRQIDTSTKQFKLFMTFYIGGLIFAILCVIRFPFNYVETGRYTYKVTIDNESISYLIDNFDILEIEDNVLTIQDKENK